MGPITGRLKRRSRKWWDATAALLSSATKQRSCQTNYAKRGKIYLSAARRRGLWQGREARFIRLQPPRPTGWSKEREQRTKRRSDTDRAAEGRTKCCCGNPELSPPPWGAKARAWGGKTTTEKKSRSDAAAWGCVFWQRWLLSVSPFCALVDHTLTLEFRLEYTHTLCEKQKSTTSPARDTQTTSKDQMGDGWERMSAGGDLNREREKVRHGEECCWPLKVVIHSGNNSISVSNHL